MTHLQTIQEFTPDLEKSVGEDDWDEPEDRLDVAYMDDKDEDKEEGRTYEENRA